MFKLNVKTFAMTAATEKLADNLHSWHEEMSSAYLYRVLAAREQGQRRALFEELAVTAERQAGLWNQQITQAGAASPGHFSPNLRTRIVAGLINYFRPQTLRPVLAAMKVRGLSVYLGPVTGHDTPEHIDDVGLRHKGIAQGGNLRAGVFGVNDGLVSNASLILGVAGATGDGKLILLSGVAGLLAGAFSMASGEYISVRSQREMFEYQIGMERDELKLYPHEETAELALIYGARGLSKSEAEKLADYMTSDPQRALDALAREELGLNIEQLGSPWGAAITSFFAFGGGALVPLLPYVLGSGQNALVWSVGLAAAALFGVGCAMSLFTGKSALYSGLRMLLIGSCAGLATYLIGSLLGVRLS